MTSSLILALDIGTSSVRAALFDLSGQMLPETLVKNEWTLEVTDDGGADIDAEVAFKQVVQVIGDVLAKSSKARGEITHVASCAFWHSLVGVDARGKMTTKVFGWADTRSCEYTAILRSKFDEKIIHNRTGARFHSSFWPAKLLWLQKENRKAFDGTAKWLSFSDYLLARLCGTATTSVSMASATGIFDQRQCVWDAKLLGYLKLNKSKLPVIAENDSQSFELKALFKRRWPRLKNAFWFPAIGDGAANNIGSGCTTKKRAALMIGTSGAMRIAYRGEPPENLPPGLWCYRIDRERIIVGGALSDGGNLYEWLKQIFRIDLPDETIGAEIARRGADAHGLTVLPFFFGERSTGYNETARGSIIGLTAAHDAIDILQAAMEAVAFRFAEILDQLKEVAKIEEIITSGGALSSSPVWTQIIADVLCRNILLLNEPEASLRGSCLLALESLGKINMTGIASNMRMVRFHSKCHKSYLAAQTQHRKKI